MKLRKTNLYLHYRVLFNNNIVNKILYNNMYLCNILQCNAHSLIHVFLDKQLYDAKKERRIFIFITLLAI